MDKIIPRLLLVKNKKFTDPLNLCAFKRLPNFIKTTCEKCIGTTSEGCSFIFDIDETNSDYIHNIILINESNTGLFLDSYECYINDYLIESYSLDYIKFILKFYQFNENYITLIVFFSRYLMYCKNKRFKIKLNFSGESNYKIAYDTIKITSNLSREKIKTLKKINKTKKIDAIRSFEIINGLMPFRNIIGIMWKGNKDDIKILENDEIKEKFEEINTFSREGFTIYIFNKPTNNVRILSDNILLISVRYFLTVSFGSGSTIIDK